MRRLIATAALIMAASAVQAGPSPEGVCLAFGPATRENQITFETADTEDERRQGLMFRESMPENHGMLFRYEVPQSMSFWMRNTLIPLDIIFMDSQWTVRKIHRGAKPHDETPIFGADREDPDRLRQFVLEVNAGVADKMGVKVNDLLMIHRCVGAAPSAQ